MKDRKVESKVTATTITAAVIAFVLWVLSEYVFHTEVPQPVQGLIAVIVPAVVTFVAGYVTRHTDRPGLPPAADPTKRAE